MDILDKIKIVRCHSVALLFVLSGLFLFCIQCTQQETIKIGAVLPLSGTSSGVGAQLERGMRMALEEVNARGGINGRKLELLLEDGQSNVAVSKEAYERLATQNPLVIFTGNSTVSKALATLADAKKQLTFALLAADANVSKGRSWVYQYWATADQEVDSMFSIIQDLNLNNIGILYLDVSYGQAINTMLQEKLAESSHIVVSESFSLKTKQMNPYVKKLLNMDAVCVVGFVSNNARILRDFDRANYRGRIILSTTGTPKTIRSMPEAQGVFVVAPVIYNENFVFAKEMMELFENKYHQPFDHYAASSYDFMELLCGILEETAPTQKALKKRLAQGFMYSGTLGNIELEPGAHLFQFPLFATRVHRGALEYR